MVRFGGISDVVVGVLVSVDIGTIDSVHTCEILVIQCTKVKLPFVLLLVNSGVAA